MFLADFVRLNIPGKVVTLLYVPPKSNPMLPSLASMREEKAPPTCKSTLAAVVCQSSEAAFHWVMWLGVVQAFQTCSVGAAIFVSTVIFIVFSSNSLVL